MRDAEGLSAGWIANRDLDELRTVPDGVPGLEGVLDRRIFQSVSRHQYPTAFTFFTADQANEQRSSVYKGRCKSLYRQLTIRSLFYSLGLKMAILFSPRIQMKT